MDNDTAAGEAPEKGARRRIQTACEACRATKIRCQPSEKPGVCRKCLDSKKECISRTGPRTRRSNRAKQGQDTIPPQAPLAVATASSTFSIDFSIPAQHEADDSFDILRSSHETDIESMLPPPDEEDDYMSSFADLDSNFYSTSTNSHSGGGASRGDGFPTPPASSSTTSHSIEDLHGKPTFNLSSASSLLTAFESMLPHLPCVALRREATVPQLAAETPFLLLAILAAASGSRTLQGHSLYDAEFRKVLGLKFVAGGERSLELLQGLVVYCAWYPFHLRPKNKQVFHYIRMATDLVHDLELDQEPVDLDIYATTEEQLQGIRVYLAYCYIATSFTIAWRKYRDLSPVLTAWTLTCCDILERHSTLDDDRVLATLVRYSSIVGDASSAIHEPQGQTEQQRRLVLLGLEAQAQGLRQHVPPHIAVNDTVKLSRLFIEVYTSAGPLMVTPRPRNPSTSPTLPPTPAKLVSSIKPLRELLDHVTQLDINVFSSFTAVDWGRLIIAVILAFRLSFRLPECQQFDHVHARNELRLGEFLGYMCAETDLTPSASKVDVLSASRVVFRVVKDKFNKRLQLAKAAEVNSIRLPRSVGCPMLDGSLDEFFPIWDAGLTGGMAPFAVGGGSQAAAVTARPVFHDLWATMTMGWADESPGGYSS